MSSVSVTINFSTGNGVDVDGLEFVDMAMMVCPFWAGSGVDEGDGVVACDDGEVLGMAACPFLIRDYSPPHL